MHRKRSRLQGGHKVRGALQPLTQPAYGQTSSGPAQSFRAPHGASTQPRPPQPPHSQQQPMMPQQQQQQQQQQPDNTWGWGGTSAWNWGEGGEEWSSGAPQHPQQQPHQQQHYPQHYSQPHPYPQHPPQQQPPQPSIQQQFGKPADVTTYSHLQHTATSQPQTQSQPQPQYLNGSSQNGNNVDDWGNWGDDWGSADSYNNNVNNNNSSISSKPASYGKQEGNSEHHQNYHAYHQFQQQQQHQQHQQHHLQQQHQQQQLQQPHQQQQQQQHQQQQLQQQHQQQQQQQQQHQQQEQYHQKQGQQQHHSQYTTQQQQYTPQQPQQQHTENRQPYSEQEYSTHYQHQPAQPQLEATQQQQLQQQQQQPAADDNWEWGTDDDWQVNGQVTEQPQETTAQQASQPPQQSVSCETAGEGETTVSQPAVDTTSTAGDGWPDWEEQTHTAASHMSQQQQHQEPHNHIAEPTTYPGSEEAGQTQHDVSQWTHQQWEGSWGLSNTQETAAGHHSMTHAIADATVTTTTTTAEHQSYGHYDSYQQELLEGGGTYAPPEEQHHQSAQQDHHHSVTTASEGSVPHSKGEATTTTTATSLQTSTLMMNNFDDDNWGDGWGEVEAPQPPHSNAEPTTQQPTTADAQDHDDHYAEEQQPARVAESTPHDPEKTHQESIQQSQSYTDQPHRDSPKDTVLPEESHISTYSNEGTSEGWDNAWDEENDKMTESVTEAPPAAATSGYMVHTMTKELADLTLQSDPTADGTFSLSSISEGSYIHPSASETSCTHSSVTEESYTKSSATEESYTKSSVTEESYTKSSATEESYTKSSVPDESYTESSATEESYTHSTVTDKSLSHSATSEASYLQYPGSNDSYTHPTANEGASFHHQYSDISSYSRMSEESSHHHSREEPYYHSSTLEEPTHHQPASGEGYHHQTVSEGGFTPPHSAVNTHQPPMTYLDQGTERPTTTEPHTQVPAPQHQIPSSQPPPPQPQPSFTPPEQLSTYQTTHYPPQEHTPQPHTTAPNQHHHIHTTPDPHRMREVPHTHHPSPSPSPHTPHPHTHHPSPSASPHAMPPHPHRPSPSPSPHTAPRHPHHPSPSPSPHQVPQPQPHPSPSPSPHVPLSHPHQAQEVNQEVAPPPPHPQPTVPDPIYSRIPDGASSIPEGPTALTGMASDRQGQGQATEAPWQAGSAGDSGSGPEVSAEHQAALHPSHPSHPLVERPASNQSAHSVHSIHSIRSTHSTHSAHSSHSLTLNQEVPLDEEVESQASSTPTGHQREQVGVVPSGGANRPSWEGVSAPPTLPLAPPQGPGPLGAIQSLKARKGSPFQPPTSKDSAPSSAQPPSYQFFTPSQVVTGDATPAKPTAVYPDVSANLETLPDNNELINSATEQSGPPLWSTTDPRMDIKLAVAVPPSDAPPVQAPPPSNPIPVVVPGLLKEERVKEEPTSPQQPTHGTHTEPPAAHSASMPAGVAKPKIQSFPPLAGSGTPSSPAALDLSMPSRVPLEATTAEDRPQEERDTPNFSRMVPGESRKGESAAAAPPAFQTPAIVPSMPSERVVTGNDNPQPVVAVGIKQEPSEVRSPPDGPDTSRLPSQAAPVVVPPVRSETIGSEEPKLRNFTSGNSGSRSDLSGERGERGSGRWEQDHSRDRGGDAGSHRGASDRYRDRSRERGSTRDYYRDDSPHSRRSYDRDYDDRRRWRGRDSDEDEDSDRRYYDSRDRRERAYRDEMDRYSDRPSREDGKERRDGSASKRRDYKDRSKDSYRGGAYDDDPYFGGGSGRGDRSQPMSRSSSINNLDEADPRSSHLHHHHRSLHHHHHSDYYDRRDSRSRDSDPRERDTSYGSRDHRDYYSRGWDSRDARRDHQRYYGAPRGYEDMYEQYHHYYQYNQYYKDYYQWMKQYRQAYQPESFYDDRTSIHSGRSSVNNEPEKSVSSPRPAYDPYGYFYGPPSQPPLHSSQFLQDFHGTSALRHFEPSPIYPEGSLSQLKSYPSGELSGVPSVADDAVSEVAQRMTPAHFGRPHISARFTPAGQMVLVLPKDPRDGEKAVVQLRDVQKMLCVDPAESRAIMQMKNYPGPLTLSDTHKDVVMRHCEHKAAEAARSLTLPDKESVMLIWEYLALLVKQNGKLFGSDIAGLLLKGREVGPSTIHAAPHTEESPEDEPTDNSPQDEGIDLPSQPPAPPPARDEAVLLKKFTEYLCLGRKKEAVDYAIQEGLWGHALALAYKMDSTTHTRVLAAFMSHIPHNDVVLTLFQQLSGKKPEITKNYSPEQWGDWRQHLAVMISNPTGASHKDRASIVVLGDTLAARGQLHAAHFCYLVAGVEWGSYACKDSKLVLIGASHHLPFQAFATVEAIQCTEVYEFARSLDGNNSPSLDTFQSYKLVYALRLTECGFPAEALRYCEVINQAVEKNPTAYKVEFLSQVYELACRLKYHDLHYQMYQGEVSEIPDPQWLSNLRDILDAARQREHQQMMELHDTAGTEDMHSYTYQQDQGTVGLTQTVAGDPTYIMADTTQNHVTHMDPHSMSYSVPGSQSYQQVDPSYTTQPSPDALDSSQYTGSPNSPSKGADAASTNPSHPQGVMGLPQEEGPSAVETPMTSQPSPEHSQYPQDTTGYQATYQQHEPYHHPTSQTPNSYEQGSGGGEQQQQQQQSMSSNTPLSQPSSQEGYPGYQQQQQQPFQSWGQPQPTEGGGVPPQPDAPSRSPEPPASQMQRTPEEEAYWAEMSNKKSGGGSSSNSNKEASPKETKAEEDKKSAGKESKTSGANKGGWFSSLLGWKSSTPQAVLPDDKNPKIVWDKEKKTWVNTDGSEETTAAVGPPPKIPQAIRGPPPSVSRSGNRMTRYVDPMRDKAGGAPGGTQPAPMLPSMPMPSVSPSLMMPQPMQPSQEGAEAGDNPSQPQPPLQPQPQQPTPAPAPVPAPAPEVAQGTLSEEEARGAVPMMAPPVGQPQFFDPSQFKPPSSTPANLARRAGPGRRSFPANR